jgi:quinol monooxygenase YgiN
MTIVSVVGLQFDPAKVDEALVALQATLVDTRAFKGCVSVDVAKDVSTPGHVILVERSESLADDEAYRAFRANGGPSPLGAFVTGAPTTVVAELQSDI